MLYLPNNQFFSFDLAGKFISNGEWIHRKALCSTYEIIFVLTGVVYIAEESQKYELTSNSTLILDPNKTHYGYQSSTDTSFYWFHFNTNIPIPFKYQLLNSDFYDLKYSFKKLVHFQNSSLYSREYLDTIAFSVFSEINLMNKISNNRGISIVNEISDYISVNSRKNITISDIAKRFNYSKEYINNFFKNHTGVSLKAKIVDMRLNYAKNLLLNTNYSIKKISSIMEFESDNHFIKFFTYHEKITPTDFRNLHSNTHIVS